MDSDDEDDIVILMPKIGAQTGKSNLNKRKDRDDDESSDEPSAKAGPSKKSKAAQPTSYDGAKLGEHRTNFEWIDTDAESKTDWISTGRIRCTLCRKKIAVGVVSGNLTKHARGAKHIRKAGAKEKAKLKRIETDLHAKPSLSAAEVVNADDAAKKTRALTHALGMTIVPKASLAALAGENSLFRKARSSHYQRGIFIQSCN